MKRIVSLLALLALIAAAPAAAQVQSLGPTTSSDDATAFSRIVAPIDIEATKDLSFGAIIKGNGTVTITPTSDVSSPGPGTVTPSGVIMLPTHNNIAQADGGFGQANFRVTGEPGFVYNIYLPGNALNTITPGMININNNPPLPVNSLQVNSFTSFPSGSGVIDAGGESFFNVGATLHCDASKRAGLYRAEFHVVVQYQ